MIIIVWTASAWVACKSLHDVMAVGRQTRQNQGETADTLFNQAQREYLKGHWTEAESLLNRRLESEPRDMESRLLYATMLRHIRRLKDARMELNLLQKFDESIQWEFEIRREWQLIDLIEQAEEDDILDEATFESPHGLGATEGDSPTSTRNRIGQQEFASPAVAQRSSDS